MSSQQHRSDPRILDRRSLRNDHRCLAGILSPGMSVLDIGCGTGAITKGIAEAVGPTGSVLGIDRDSALIQQARVLSTSLPHLRFEEGDATNLNFEQTFDVVSAARTLQWIAKLNDAIASMKCAAKPGGLIVVLDYNHVLNEWQPAPPAQFRAFYDAFLAWRHSNGWDNEIANHLPELFEQAGLKDIRIYDQNEASERGDPDFDQKTSLWTSVIENLTPALRDTGHCAAGLLDSARHDFETWRKAGLIRQTLSMKTIMARVPTS